MVNNPKCDDRRRPIHDAGALADCPTCQATQEAARRAWKPPRWQLSCPDGSVFDYDAKPWNPIVRVVLYFKGYRWHRYPWLGPRGGMR